MRKHVVWAGLMVLLFGMGVLPLPDLPLPVVFVLMALTLLAPLVASLTAASVERAIAVLRRSPDVPAMLAPVESARIVSARRERDARPRAPTRLLIVHG